MILKRTISKEEVKEMPKAAFPGRIHVIQTESETQKAVAYLCLLYTSDAADEL